MFGLLQEVNSTFTFEDTVWLVRRDFEHQYGMLKQEK